jgi:hypothetical protein
LEYPGSIARTFQNPFQNQQMVHFHIFGALSTILTLHTNLPDAIYPEEVRNYLHEDFLRKVLPLEEPTNQLLKPRKEACVDSTCSYTYNIHYKKASNSTCTDL